MRTNIGYKLTRPSSLAFEVVVTMITATLFGMVGGGVVGGVVGYAVAMKQSSEPITLPRPVGGPPDNNFLSTLTNTLTTNSKSPQMNGYEPLVQAIEQVKPATVGILSHTDLSESTGSGILIDSAGYIVTNYQVIQHARILEVILSHGEQVKAQLIGSTIEYNLALIKIEAHHVPAVAMFGDSSLVKQGEQVAAIGRALGDLRNTVTSGIISAHNRELGGLRGLLQTDTPINRGSSGGPLINLRGQIIGINILVLPSGRLGNGEDEERLGFSIPSNTVKMVVKQLIENGEVHVPYLGVYYEVLNPQKSMEHDLVVSQGAYVTEVLNDTPAQVANLQANDVIVAINNQLVDDTNPLPQQLLEHEVGKTIILTIIRGQQNLSIEVTLGLRTDGL